MSALTIHLNGDQLAYLPGEIIRGEIAWQFDHAPHALELRLLWLTRGKGEPDVQGVERRQFDPAGPRGKASFEWTLPNGPYSFSGQLVSVVWALELVALPGETECQRLEIVLSPTGRPIELHPLVAP
jgi:hypothetical protein